MSDYPSAIYSPRTKENRAGVVYDAGKTTIGYAEDIVYLDGEVVAIETELGATPKNTSASVAERLKGIRSLSDSNSDVINIKAGKVGIGTASPPYTFSVNGSLYGTSYFYTNSGYTTSSVSRSKIVSGVRAGGGADVWEFHSGNAVYTGGSHTWFIDAVAKLIINSAGNVGFSTTTPTAKVDINSDILRLRTAKTPASASASGNTGDICWDTDYIYICIATNTWKRVAIATW